MSMPKPAKKCLFYLFITFVVVLIMTPVFFLITTSFMSNNEAYTYPLPIIPAFSYKFQVKKHPSKYGDSYFIGIYNKNSKEFESVLDTSSIDQIRTYFRQQLSVSVTNKDITDKLGNMKNGDIIQFSFRKDLLYNYTTFFIVVRDAFPALLRSIEVAFLTILISLVIGGMAGYAFARYIYKGKDITKVTILFVRMFPAVSLAVPMVLILTALGLFDCPFGLSLVYSVGSIALTAWITASIFVGLPVELEEAAQVFGATKLRVFFKITLPLALPGLAAASMYAFLGAWNETVCALLLTQNNPTFAVVVYQTLVNASGEINLVAAGGICMAIPAILFTLIIKKYIKQMWGGVSV